MLLSSSTTRIFLAAFVVCATSPPDPRPVEVHRLGDAWIADLTELSWQWIASLHSSIRTEIGLPGHLRDVPRGTRTFGARRDSRGLGAGSQNGPPRLAT